MTDVNCRLVVDSDGEVPQRILDRAGVDFISLPYYMNDGERYDDMGETMSHAEFYRRMRGGEKVTTSAAPVTEIEEKFEEYAREGTPTVYLALSSRISSTYNSAELVAQQVRERHPDFEIHIVDTKLMSMGEGFLDFEAMRQRRRGLTARQLAAWAEEARWYVNCLLTVEDLEYLRRGGRMPAEAGSINTALKVNPTFSFDTEGRLSLAGVPHGRKKALKALVSSYASCHPDGSRSDETVVIASADADKDATWVEEHLDRPKGSIPALRWNIGASIGAHVGPGTVGIACWGPDRRGRKSLADRIAEQAMGAEGEQAQGD